jgi:hypothetical protein
MRRAPAEALYVLAGLPWALVSLALLLPMLFAGTVLSVTLVGVPVLGLALFAARSAAALDCAAARRLLTVEVPDRA